jgi:hypothetical protein
VEPWASSPLPDAESLHLDAALTGFMSRFGEPKPLEEPTPVRISATESWVERRGGERDLITVRIKAARNMPLMDLFNGADVFCAVFVENTDGLFQTQIRRGSSERDWQWDEAFEWYIPRTPRQRLIVMVYDKDQVGVGESQIYTWFTPDSRLICTGGTTRTRWASGSPASRPSLAAKARPRLLAVSRCDCAFALPGAVDGDERGGPRRLPAPSLPARRVDGGAKLVLGFDRPRLGGCNAVGGGAFIDGGRSGLASTRYERSESE